MTDSFDTDLYGLGVHDCLLGVMVLASMSDGVVRTSELLTIESIIDHFPIFAEYNEADVKKVCAVMNAILLMPDGIDRFLTLLKVMLPPRLCETAYAIACDVVAADGKLEQAELRFLEEIACHLQVDPLYVAAIERSTRALYARF